MLSTKGDFIMIYGVIYKVTCLITDMIYVGQTTKTAEKRFKEHTCADSPLGRDIRKFGKKSFIIEILEECASQDQLNEREFFWIAKLNCVEPNGYNRTIGGSPRNDRNEFREEIRRIGMRITFFRKKKNMTQAELADKLNINKSYLSQIENASANKIISLPMLIRISRVLELDPALLITDDDTIYKSDLKCSWNNMKEMLEEMNKLKNKMLEQFEKADKIFSNKKVEE